MNKVSGSGNRQRALIELRSSLWFVPALIVLSAALLALGLLELDNRLMATPPRWWPEFLTPEGEGARAILATIAGSMITVAGVVFSITIVALTLASSQYTSRVLRNFMRDHKTQTVLGVFVGVFIYCILVLLRVSTGAGREFVPVLAVLGGVLLAMLGMGFLIFFIHHIAAAIQASDIIASITQETLEAVDHLFPQELGQEEDETAATHSPLPAETIWHAVPSLETGYIQGIDMEGLLAFAREYDLILRMESGIGEFVAEGRPITWLTGSAPPTATMIRELNDIYAIDSYRTTDQDAPFGIRQLVDIALKALSPGINDTTTAVMCVEYLSLILSRVAARRIESSYRFDGGEMRVIARGPTFASLASGAFDQILENAEGNTAVLTAVLTAIEQIAKETRSRCRREILLERVQIASEIAEGSLKSSHARKSFQAHIAHLRSGSGMEGALDRRDSGRGDDFSP